MPSHKNSHSQLGKIDLAHNNAGAELQINFFSAQHNWRRTRGQKNELLRRALGLKKNNSPLVLDATAGLGRDAFIMASLGCRVDLVERSPIIANLLAAGLKRGANETEITEIISRMSLHQADFLTFQPVKTYDIIYLDPMFPQRHKSALVKKELRLLRQLVGNDQDADALLAAASKLTPCRIVVKRPKGATPLAAKVPHHAIIGKKNRFDIYLPPW